MDPGSPPWILLAITATRNNNERAGMYPDLREAPPRGLNNHLVHVAGLAGAAGILGVVTG